jgi:hypothetical protein
MGSGGFPANRLNAVNSVHPFLGRFFLIIDLGFVVARLRFRVCSREKS